MPRTHSAGQVTQWQVHWRQERERQVITWEGRQAVGVFPARGVGAVLTRHGRRARVIPRAGCHATPDVRVFRFKMPAERSDDHLRRLVVWVEGALGDERHIGVVAGEAAEPWSVAILVRDQCRLACARPPAICVAPGRDGGGALERGQRGQGQQGLMAECRGGVHSTESSAVCASACMP